MQTGGTWQLLAIATVSPFSSQYPSLILFCKVYRFPFFPLASRAVCRAHFASICEDAQIGVETVSHSGLTEKAHLFEQLIAHLKELVSLTSP